MGKFRVVITEQLRKVVVINAANKEEARYKVEKKYKEGEIILSGDDFADVFITPAFSVRKQKKATV